MSSITPPHIMVSALYDICGVNNEEVNEEIDEFIEQHRECSE